jgi:hypothetical protein
VVNLLGPIHLEARVYGTAALGWTLSAVVQVCHIYPAVSCVLATAVARLRSQVRTCEICRGQRDTETDFLQLLRFLTNCRYTDSSPLTIHHQGVGKKQKHRTDAPWLSVRKWTLPNYRPPQPVKQCRRLRVEGIVWSAQLIPTCC